MIAQLTALVRLKLRENICPNKKLKRLPLHLSNDFKRRKHNIKKKNRADFGYLSIRTHYEIYTMKV